MTTQAKLYVISKDDVAPNLRKYVLEQQNEAIERHDVFRVAVSGGSLAETLATALLAPSSGRKGDMPEFGKWEIFYADERCVPLDDKDSNHKLFADKFLGKLPAGSPQPKVFSIDESVVNDEQEMADRYQKTLASVFAPRDSVVWPLFDLILLGCGPDGHTCSLFPGREELDEKEAWVLPVRDSPKQPPRRITLTLPVVCRAAKIAFVATGEGKKDILKQIFEDVSESLPCALVNKGAGDRVSWFCDEAAATAIGSQYPRRSSIAQRL